MEYHPINSWMLAVPTARTLEHQVTAPAVKATEICSPRCGLFLCTLDPLDAMRMHKRREVYSSAQATLSLSLFSFEFSCTSLSHQQLPECEKEAVRRNTVVLHDAPCHLSI
eukprot:gnl/TRDRNA2_/TRDRNA2_205344_c0_seq1.p1 gnl/TRDRNA2_/TRDRNA2_205344_c0~~gnl/TRDRNA2_/TRDRNA2_205344_c0_seq1.p1  ORF type:complete len:111 (+),score=5.03 gnl/TRDRNA2_/TRDRNA2_205344_c0_seq1:121-453(+)